MSLRYAVIHPITGWGLDSFRNGTGEPGGEKHVYAMQTHAQIVSGRPKELHLAIWDNPHNLYISLFYEWGVFGLIFLGGYIRFLALRFKNAIKTPNLLALTGFIIVFFVTSLAYFPIFLARMAIFIVPCFALFEIESG